MNRIPKKMGPLDNTGLGAGGDGNIRLSVIYYGEHTPEIDSAIIAFRPQYIIANSAHGLWGEVYGYDTQWLLHDIPRYQEAGIKVIGYLTSGYEHQGRGSGIELKWYSLEINKKFIKNMAEIDGVDGVFIDECSSYPDRDSKEYLKELTELAHSYGLIVWGNTGHDDFDEWFFTDGGFDFMHSSEQWRGQLLSEVQRKWGHRISVTGFNPSYTAEDAYKLIKNAWDKGLAYAYVSNSEGYDELPTWITDLTASLLE
jgi:hypothetical protein